MSWNGALPVNYCPEHGDLLANGLREDDMRSGRCREAHTIAEIRASVRPYGTVTPTLEEWAAQMDAERARQIEHGYDDAHDAQHGAAHLLKWAIDYARRGNNLAAATMARCALRLLLGTVTDTERQAVADAIDNTAVITPRDEFLGGSTIANILEVADAALEAAKEARS